MPVDLLYVVLIFALFVVPKVLQRWRLPSAITSLLLGALASAFGLFPHDRTIELLSTFGIVSLFLFAGMDLDVRELRRGARVISQHLALRALALAGAAWVVAHATGLGLRVAVLAALALLTSSAGFILDSLDTFGLSEEGRFWTRAKVIAAEVLALAVLFVALQSTSWLRFALATAALAAVMLVVPVLFRLFARLVAPFAPRSEFAFLLMVAVLCAYATKRLGVYYLVGAFLVGAAAQRFRERLPALSSEKVLHATEAFASVFAPFYFFKAGLHLRAADFTLEAILVGLLFLAVCIPLRVGQVSLHHRVAAGETWHDSLRVSVALLPTLVFTLVIAEILRDHFAAPAYLFGGLMVYTLTNTIIPGLLLRAPLPEYDTPHLDGAPPLPLAAADAGGPAVTSTPAHEDAMEPATVSAAEPSPPSPRGADL